MELPELEFPELEFPTFEFTFVNTFAALTAELAPFTTAFVAVFRAFVAEFAAFVKNPPRVDVELEGLELKGKRLLTIGVFFATLYIVVNVELAASDIDSKPFDVVFTTLFTAGVAFLAIELKRFVPFVDIFLNAYLIFS